MIAQGSKMTASKQSKTEELPALEKIQSLAQIVGPAVICEIRTETVDSVTCCPGDSCGELCCHEIQCDIFSSTRASGTSCVKRIDLNQCRELY
jgi:hypothetical protein